MKRQIREMLWAVGGYRVKRLARIRIGALTDPRLKTGHWRPLRRHEIDALSKIAPAKTPDRTVRKS
ncbi:MAG: hypothetical protein WA771_14860, partial [Chthoniobacterales bacterium]